MRLVANSLV